MTTSSKKWVIALAVSGALNCFLVGAIAVHVGAPARDRSERHIDAGGGQAGPAMLREMIHALGGPGDPRVQKIWGPHQAQWRAARREIKQARGQVRSALASTPFDEQKFDEALAELHAVTSRAQAHSRATVVALAKELSPSERQSLVRRAPK